MMNKLTSVPHAIPTISVTDSGRCNADPMSFWNSNGTTASIVVSDVIMMGRKRQRPAHVVKARHHVRQRVALRQFYRLAQRQLPGLRHQISNTE